ncbi:MAG: hypothetical protein ABII27_08850 [bacterium]
MKKIILVYVSLNFFVCSTALDSHAFTSLAPPSTIDSSDFLKEKLSDESETGADVHDDKRSNDVSELLNWNAVLYKTDKHASERSYAALFLIEMWKKYVSVEHKSSSYHDPKRFAQQMIRNALYSKNEDVIIMIIKSLVQNKIFFPLGDYSAIVKELKNPDNIEILMDYHARFIPFDGYLRPEGTYYVANDIPLWKSVFFHPKASYDHKIIAVQHLVERWWFQPVIHAGAIGELRHVNAYARGALSSTLRSNDPEAIAIVIATLRDYKIYFPFDYEQLLGNISSEDLKTLIKNYLISVKPLRAKTLAIKTTPLMYRAKKAVRTFLAAL